MARKKITTRICDMTGSDIDVHEHIMVIDGATVEIDLAVDEYTKLRTTLQPYFAAGRRTGPVAGTKPARTRELKEIRQWCADHGYNVSTRGRVHHEYEAAYHRAKATAAAEDTADHDTVVPVEDNPAYITENYSQGAVPMPAFTG